MKVYFIFLPIPSEDILIEMKSILTFLIALFVFASASGQEVKQQVISSAGGYSVSGDNSISLSWTLGELVIATVTSTGGDLILTQGFQQSKLDLTAVELHPDLGVTVTIYPNPTSEMINIRFSTPLEGTTMVYLIAPDGKLVINEEIPSGMTMMPIDMQQYPAGTYFLRIQNNNKQNIYKVIKL